MNHDVTSEHLAKVMAYFETRRGEWIPLSRVRLECWRRGDGYRPPELLRVIHDLARAGALRTRGGGLSHEPFQVLLP